MLEKSKYTSDNKHGWTQSCHNLVWNTSSEQQYSHRLMAGTNVIQIKGNFIRPNEMVPVALSDESNLIYTTWTHTKTVYL